MRPRVGPFAGNDDSGLRGPTLFQALEKLGLRLEKSKTKLAVWVIDRVVKTPEAN